MIASIRRVRRISTQHTRTRKSAEPSFAPVRIAERRQFAPGDHQRLLHGALGSVEVPEDPLRDREQPVAVRAGEDAEGLAVSVLRLPDEVAFERLLLRRGMPPCGRSASI